MNSIQISFIVGLFAGIFIGLYAGNQRFKASVNAAAKKLMQRLAKGKSY